MIYHIQYGQLTIEFTRNEGQSRVEAADPAAATKSLRKIFPHLRNEVIAEETKGCYLIRFKVSLDYRLPLLRNIEKSVRLLRTKELYERGRYLDRYIVAVVCKESGQPEYLAGGELRKEISSLRRAAVVARDLPNELNFVDYDICIYNYLELNSKEGYKSRVVRRVIS